MGSLASKHLDRLDLSHLDLDRLDDSRTDGAAVGSAGLTDALTEFAVGASLAEQDRTLAEDPWEAGLATGNPGATSAVASPSSASVPSSTTAPPSVAQALQSTIAPPPTSTAPPPTGIPAATPVIAPPQTVTTPAAPPTGTAAPLPVPPPPQDTAPVGNLASPAALSGNAAPQPVTPQVFGTQLAPAIPTTVDPPPTDSTPADPISVDRTSADPTIEAPPVPAAISTVAPNSVDQTIETPPVPAAIATAVVAAAAAKPPVPPIPAPVGGRSPLQPVSPLLSGLAAGPPTKGTGDLVGADPIVAGAIAEPVAEPILDSMAAPVAEARPGSLAEEASATPNVTPSQDPNTSEDQDESNLLEQLQTLLIGPEVDELETRLAAIESSLGNPAEMAALLGPDLNRLAAQQVQRASQSLYQAVSRAVYRTLTAKIDEAIYQRGHEDIDAMSRALAAVLPAAIQREIEQAPSAIAHALGPEIAAAIERQIQVNRGAISDALASEIGLAMKRQIEIERDAMVDALYPVIGSTISKYMQEAVQEINNKVSQAMTLQGFQRKIKARVQGVSEAELILSESLGFTVTAVFLIHKASGLPIAEVQAEDQNLETELLAGMLTAIRSFANDCIARADTSEISEIDYGNSRILLEVAGYCYLAAIVRGTQPRWYVERMRRVLSGLVLRFDREIANYDGDPATVPTAVQTQLDRLLLNTSSPAKVKGWPLVQWLVGGGAVLLLAGWGWNSWRSAAAQRAESAVEQAWYQAPTLSVYGLSAQHDGDRLYLRGRVPTPWLRQEAERVAAAALSQKGIEGPLLNEIVAVDVPPPPEQTRSEVERLVARLAPGGRLRAEYQPDLSPTPGSAPAGTVRLRGQFRDRAEAAALVAALAKLPGVRAVLPNAAIAPSPSDLRIYFVANSAILAGADPAGKIAAIARQLYASPQSTLTIIGYSPPEEAPGDRLPVARQRAETVRAALIAQGVGGDRLRLEARAARPNDVPAGAAAWESHCVAFELQVNEP